MARRKAKVERLGDGVFTKLLFVAVPVGVTWFCLAHGGLDVVLPVARFLARLVGL